MTTIPFDTLEASRRLREAGFDELVTREHFDAKIDLLRVENSHTRWMLGVTITLAAANFIKQFF